MKWALRECSIYKLQETINLLTERDYFALLPAIFIKQIAIAAKREPSSRRRIAGRKVVVERTHFCNRARDDILINICCVTKLGGRK